MFFRICFIIFRMNRFGKIIRFKILFLAFFVIPAPFYAKSVPEEL